MISKFKIPVLRRIDRVAGVTIIKSQNILREKSYPPKQVKKILIIKLFGFGNFIFLSPVFKAIKEVFPGAKLHVLTFEQNKEICSMYNNMIDEIHTIQFSTVKMGFSIISFAVKHYKEFDIAMDFEQFVRLSAIIGRLTKPKYFIGMATASSGKISAFDNTLLYNEHKHIVEEYYEVALLLSKLYKKKIEKKPKLQTPTFRSTAKSRSILKLAKGKTLIGMCPGGRADDPERKYPVKRMAQAIMMLTDDIENKKLQVSILLFGTLSEKKDIEYMKSSVRNSKICIDCSGTSLNDSSYLMSKCQAFISNDTGPIHLAASIGVFCIGLYGPSKHWIYGPYTKQKVILRDSLHKPVRSNHNEKDTGWNPKWWPKPENIYLEMKKILKY